MKIGVIGAIGVGKSTFTKNLAREWDAVLSIEPVAHNPHLPKFYKGLKHPKENMRKLTSVGAQLSFIADYLFQELELLDNERVVFDSTVLSNLVFNEMLKEQGDMYEEDVELIYHFVKRHTSILEHVDYYVILRKPKELCFANVGIRGREMEQDQHEYLHYHYDNYERIVRKILEFFEIPKDRIIWWDEEENRDDSAARLLDCLGKIHKTQP